MFRTPWYHGRLFSRTNLLLLIGLSCCQPRHPDRWPGRSPTTPPEEQARAAPRPLASPWRDFAVVGQLALMNRDALPTNNHNPFEWNLRVRITPANLPLYERWRVGAVMPVDTWIVAEHESRAGAGTAPYYFANKTATGWVFGSATREGQLLPSDPGCARCHADATADFVFGLPLPRASNLQIDQRPDGG